MRHGHHAQRRPCKLVVVDLGSHRRGGRSLVPTAASKRGHLIKPAPACMSQRRTCINQDRQPSPLRYSSSGCIFARPEPTMNPVVIALLPVLVAGSALATALPVADPHGSD